MAFAKKSHRKSNAHMKPPVGESVGLVSPGCWSIGSFMSCEQLQGQQPPEDAVVHWQDGESAFCLRPKPPTTSSSGDPTVGKFHEERWASAVWTLSTNVFCKAKAWVEGMEVEGTTIEFVAKHAPSVPVPEVIYHWIDPAWTRCFLITKRAQGERFNEVWPRISEDQRLDVAAQLAKHAVTLSKLRSDRCEKATGAGLLGEHGLLGPHEDWSTWPSWKPLLRPPFTAQELIAHLTKEAGVAPPDLGKQFVFAHTDMSPKNVFVFMPAEKTGQVQVSTIIDWETAGYYPYWWMSTHARTCQDLFLEHKSIGVAWKDAMDPAWMLSNALIREGFRHELGYFGQHVLKSEIPDFVKEHEEAREKIEAGGDQSLIIGKARSSIAWSSKNLFE